MTLYVKSCPREESRTDTLAKALLERLGEYEEIDVVNEDLHPLNKDSLSFREAMIAQGNYSNPMFQYAKQFAFADTIVIAAPFWDLSFPTALKTYIENIYVTGLVTQCGEDDRPHGMCKANKLYYVTTAGGPYDPSYSYEYIKALATEHFGIKECELIYADMLDLDSSDPEKIILDKIQEIQAMTL